MPACGWIAAKAASFSSRPARLGPARDMAEYLLCERGFTPTSTIVVPRETACQVRFDEHLRVAEDTDFAIRLSLAGCRLPMLEAPGAIWNDRLNPDRLSASKGGRRNECLALPPAA